VSNWGRNWQVRVPGITLTRPGAAQEEHIGILAVRGAIKGFMGWPLGQLRRRVMGDDKRVHGFALGPVVPKFEDQTITCVCVEVNCVLGPGLD
jgi:hypothetical protein